MHGGWTGHPPGIEASHVVHQAHCIELLRYAVSSLSDWSSFCHRLPATIESRKEAPSIKTIMGLRGKKAQVRWHFAPAKSPVAASQCSVHACLAAYPDGRPQSAGCPGPPQWYFSCPRACHRHDPHAVGTNATCYMNALCADKIAALCGRRTSFSERTSSKLVLHISSWIALPC